MNQIIRCSASVLVAVSLIISGCSDSTKQPYVYTPTFHLPVVDSTLKATSITQTSAISGGAVSSDGGTALTETGICWDTLIKPTINGNKAASGTTPGTFYVNISGLLPNHLYYVKAYAINKIGVTYGDRISFTTLP